MSTSSDASDDDDTEAALAAAAAGYQARVIIPHCAVCTRPCCALTDVVLDLDWQRTKTLYQITSSRRAFERSLKDGSGPAHIREQGGRYFAHGKPCPAYDAAAHRCAVYATDTKPEECTDFPVYVDGDAVTVDLRCEAASVDGVRAALAAALPGRKITSTADPQFPVLVTFDVLDVEG